MDQKAGVKDGSKENDCGQCLKGRKKKKKKQHLYSLMGESRITVIVVRSRQELGERNRTILAILYFRI